MKLGQLFKDANLDRINLSTTGVSAEISFKANDREAAWELYIEMLTRIITQPLPDEVGDEKTALDSVYSLFPTTREILRRHGRKTIEFSKVAIPVLNQIVRPFTSKWHEESLTDAFDVGAKRKEFRKELAALQVELRNYNRLLAKIADVEDLTNFERNEMAMISAPEAARRRGISRMRLNQLINDNRIKPPPERRGRDWYVDENYEVLPGKTGPKGGRPRKESEDS